MSYRLQQTQAQQFTLQGDMVFTTAKSLCKELTATFCQPQAYTLDLSGVQQFDSAGLVSLLTAAQSCQQAQATLTLLNLPAAVTTLIGLYNLHSILG
jgi:anti-anti-sigma factor